MEWILYGLFIICIYISLTFIFSEEGKDERGQKILNRSYLFSFPIFPIGWLIIENYDRFINDIPLEVYRELISFLIPVAFIVQGMTIYFYKKTM